MKRNLSKSRYGRCRIDGAVPAQGKRASAQPQELSRRHLVRHLNFIIAAMLMLAIATVSIVVTAVHAQTAAPRYEADLSWPKPLPDRWVLGGLGGVCVDAQDHVLILNRQDVIDGDLNGAKLAPSLIEFDPAGNVVNSWGDRTLLDPRLHSCHFDKEGNVWIAAAPSGMVQKYTHDGSRLLLQIGKKGELDSSDGTDKG